MRLFPVKSPRSSAASARRPLRATIARRGSRAPMIEEEEEPTTSFKTTLIVAVLLHVVAAGGIFMFEAIKKRHPNAFETTPPPVTQKAQKTMPTAQVRSSATPAKSTVASATAAKSANGSAVAETVKKTDKTVAEIKDSGEVYTVAKGDTPVSIAKKLHVNYDDLIKLNKIEDPKKIKIGQKLRVPMKPKTANT